MIDSHKKKYSNDNVKTAPSVIMKMTGHKTAAMFNRYNTVDFGDAQEAYRKLDEFLKQEQKPVNSGKSRVGTKFLP